jgi:hypothetical protein
LSAAQDGGAAFPFHDLPAMHGSEGMSLRDWFAGQALAGIVSGLCANPGTQPDEPCWKRAMGRFVFAHAADDALAIADAMIAARATGGAS